jgi:hypothetical protein
MPCLEQTQLNQAPCVQVSHHDGAQACTCQLAGLLASATTTSHSCNAASAALFHQLILTAAIACLGAAYATLLLLLGILDA